MSKRQVKVLLTQIVTIYRNVYTLPPYRKPQAEIIDFENSLPIHLEREAFRFIGAFEGNPEELVGFAYGYTSQAGQWWYDHVRSELPEATASHWLENAFQLAEISVNPEFQGRGIGSRLHDQLLRRIRHPRAILSTLQADIVAHHLYRSRGWVVLRENLFFPGVERRYQIMGLEP